MPEDPPPSPPIPNHGGRRPGAGAPRGPRLHPRAPSRAAGRLLADGKLYAVAHLAALVAPYCHHRRRILAEPAKPLPGSRTPTALVGFGGVAPDPLRALSTQNQCQAMIYSLFHDSYELAPTGRLTALDIMEAVTRQEVERAAPHPDDDRPT